MAAPKDYYKILGVDETADAKTIKAAYRRLARKHHPDAAGKGNEEQFKAINEAYHVLSDPAKRAEYDRLRRGYAQREQAGFGTGFRRVWNAREATDDWTNLFEDLFGMGGDTIRTSRTEPAVPEETMTIGLEQVALGAQVTVTVQELDVCPVCRGLGSLDCSRCGGLGKVMQPKKFDVKIPPGIQDQSVLRVGTHARLRVSVRPHPRFQRQGDNLRARVAVAVPVAAVGGEIAVKPLVGEPLTVKIPPHTNAGKVLRLKGQGLPNRVNGVRGDLLLEVELFFPEPFTDADDRLYRELLAHHVERGGEIYAPR